MSPGRGPMENSRSSPRANASLEVDVEVAGQTQRVLLVTKDIGVGGMYLRTLDPAPLWKRVRLAFDLPEGGRFEVSGEVVRSVTVEQARLKGQAPGMAVAFDEISRSRRKQLVALVLDLCARRPGMAEREPPVDAPPPAVIPAVDVDVDVDEDVADLDSDKTDALLSQLDDLLDSVEQDAEEGTWLEDEEEALSFDLPEVEIDLDLGEPNQAPPPNSLQHPEGAAGPHAPSANPRATMGDDPAERLKIALIEYQRTHTGETHYDVLGVGRQANDQQIEAAYQRLLDQLRPPQQPERLSEELMRELSWVLGKIRKAFAILAKPDRRRAYDFLIENRDEDSS